MHHSPGNYIIYSFVLLDSRQQVEREGREKEEAGYGNSRPAQMFKPTNQPAAVVAAATCYDFR
jgi:hypothetical protein